MRLYFPSTGTLGCVVWPGYGVAFSPSVPPGFYLPHVNMGPPVPLATAAAAWPSLPPCHHTVSSLPRLPISAPPSRLDEYFFFKSLVFGLLYTLVFWQFFVFCFEVSFDTSYGCVRRQSMFTYTSILVRSPLSFAFKC